MTAGDNGNFFSVRLAKKIAYFNEFSKIVSRTGDLLSSTDRRRSADHGFKNYWANSIINQLPVHKANTIQVIILMKELVQKANCLSHIALKSVGVLFE